MSVAGIAAAGALALGGLAPAAATGAAPTSTPAPAPAPAPVDTTIPGVGIPASTAPPTDAAVSTTEPPATAPRGAPAVTLPATVPLPALASIDDPDPESARLIPVPAGCAAPAVEQAVFMGTLVVHDAATARFIVGRVRSGSVEGFAVDGLIDVRYGDEVRFLDVGTTYIVGAAVDPEAGVLSSKVTQPAALFGGSEVAGVDASDLRCPVVDDPVRTLMIDGTQRRDRCARARCGPPKRRDPPCRAAARRRRDPRPHRAVRAEAARVRGGAQRPRHRRPARRRRLQLTAAPERVSAPPARHRRAASARARRSVTAWASPSGSRNSALPATSTLAPAAAAPATVVGPMPPSTSTSTVGEARGLDHRAAPRRSSAPSWRCRPGRRSRG